MRACGHDKFLLLLYLHMSILICLLGSRKKFWIYTNARQHVLRSCYLSLEFELRSLTCDHKTNVMGTLNMLGLAKRIGARFLLTSTSEVYGDPLEHPQKETYWGHVNPIGES